MNKAQERTVERIRREVFETFDLSKGEGKYEMKEFRVSENEYFVSVCAEVGMVGDEGTLAAVLCRYNVQIFVGKRGGMRYPITKKNGKYGERQFDGYWSVYLAQKVC